MTQNVTVTSDPSIWNDNNTNIYFNRVHKSTLDTLELRKRLAYDMRCQ